jgi:hypothetical protein
MEFPFGSIVLVYRRLSVRQLWQSRGDVWLMAVFSDLSCAGGAEEGV